MPHVLTDKDFNKFYFKIIPFMISRFQIRQGEYRQDALFTAGLDGLEKACKKYNQEKDCQFHTYAKIKIYYAMCVAMEEAWIGPKKMTIGKATINRHVLYKRMEELGNVGRSVVDIDLTLCREFKITLEGLYKVKLEMFLHEGSLDEPTSGDLDEPTSGKVLLGDTIAADTPPNEMIRNGILKGVESALKEFEEECKKKCDEQVCKDRKIGCWKIFAFDDCRNVENTQIDTISKLGFDAKKSRSKVSRGITDVEKYLAKNKEVRKWLI